MKAAEIVIVGGGVVGASIAYHLTQRGCRDVLVLEREDLLGFGSTGKATGGVRAQFETEINIKLSLYSLDFFRDWDFDCGYEPRGYVFLATDHKHLNFLKRSSELQRSLGYCEVVLIDPKTIAEMIPGLNCADIVGGSFGPRDGFIDPLGVLEGFSSRAIAAGASIETRREGTAINVKEEKVVGIETNDGMIDAEKVVICAGAWARSLAKTAGINLPVEPLRRQIVWAKSTNPLPADLPMVIDLSDGFHFRPQKISPTKFFLRIPTKASGRVFQSSSTIRLSKRSMKKHGIERRSWRKQTLCGENAGPGFMKTRPIITRSSVAARSKDYILRTASRAMV